MMPLLRKYDDVPVQIYKMSDDLSEHFWEAALEYAFESSPCGNDTIEAMYVFLLGGSI